MHAVTVAAVQMKIVSGDKKQNLQTAGDLIAASGRRDFDFLVLPELFSTGYSLRLAEEWSEPVPGPTTDVLAGLATSFRSYLIGSMIESVEYGKPRNTCVVIDPQGKMVAKYSKIHLFRLAREDVFLSPGDSVTDFDSKFGRMGVIICYDLRFPELSRSLGLRGVKILFVPAEWPLPRRNPWRTLIQARAIENQFFVAGANRVGFDEETKFFGDSLIVDPNGEIIAEGDETEGLIIGTADLSQIEKARNQITCYQDRRPGLYGLLRKG